MIELLNIDCMEYMKTVPDKYFDVTVTDTPYGVNFEYNSYIDSLENWIALMNKFIPEVRRISKMVIMPSCQIKQLHFIYSNFPPDWLICWYKGSTGHSSHIGFNDWEPLLVYGKTEKLFMHDYFQCQPETNKNIKHPCPKSVGWFKWLISKSSKERGKIFDPFMGSGTSAIACYDFGTVEYVGCELDKDYYDAAVKRFNYHKSQVNMFERTTGDVG